MIIYPPTIIFSFTPTFYLVLEYQNNLLFDFLEPNISLKIFYSIFKYRVINLYLMKLNIIEGGNRRKIIMEKALRERSKEEEPTLKASPLSRLSSRFNIYICSDPN